MIIKNNKKFIMSGAYRKSCPVDRFWSKLDDDEL